MPNLNQQQNNQTLLTTKQVWIRIDRSFAFKDAREAYKYLSSGSHFG
ncbi:MAG: hypothetical protein AAF383_13130 [Cyanobacteria bacterium P01_A01_bin.83]